MDKRIEEYLAKMCREISNKKARENARLEIENHFLDQIDDLVLEGKSEDEAITLVLTKAVSPSKLGAKLNLAHRPFLLRYPLTLAFTSVGIFSTVALIGFCHYAIFNHFIPQLQEVYRVDPKFASAFEDDLKVLDASGLVAAHARSKNAQSYLANFADGGEKTKAIALEQEKLQKKLLAWKVQSKSPLKIWEDKKLLQKLALDPEFKQQDHSWVEKIVEFDHWNILNDEKIKRDFSAASAKPWLEKYGVLSSYQYPEMGKFEMAVRLHSLRLIHAGKNEQAEKLMDQAFLLLDSTHTLLGHSLASVVLKFKSRYQEMFGLREWKVATKRERLAYKRLAWGWSSVFQRMAIKPESFAKWKSYLKPNLGFCVGVLESPLGSSFLRDFLDKSAPFETKHENFLVNTNQLSELHKKCGLEELSVLLKQPTEEAPLFYNEYWTYLSASDVKLPKVLQINPTRIPYVRRLIGFHLMSVAVPAFASIYEQDERTWD